MIISSKTTFVSIHHYHIFVRNLGIKQKLTFKMAKNQKSNQSELVFSQSMSNALDHIVSLEDESIQGNKFHDLGLKDYKSLISQPMTDNSKYDKVIKEIINCEVVSLDDFKSDVTPISSADLLDLASTTKVTQACFSINGNIYPVYIYSDRPNNLVVAVRDVTIGDLMSNEKLDFPQVPAEWRTVCTDKYVKASITSSENMEYKMGRDLKSMGSMIVDALKGDPSAQVVDITDPEHIFFICYYFYPLKNFSSAYLMYANSPDNTVKIVNTSSLPDIAFVDTGLKERLTADDLKVIACLIVMLMEKQVPKYNGANDVYVQYAQRRIASLYSSAMLKDKLNTFGASNILAVQKVLQRLPKFKRMLFLAVTSERNAYTDNVMTIISGQGMSTINMIHYFIHKGRTLAHLQNKVISEMREFVEAYEKISKDREMIFEYSATLQIHAPELAIKNFCNLAFCAFKFHEKRTNRTLQYYTLPTPDITGLTHLVNQELPSHILGLGTSSNISEGITEANLTFLTQKLSINITSDQHKRTMSHAQTDLKAALAELM